MSPLIEEVIRAALVAAAEGGVSRRRVSRLAAAPLCVALAGVLALAALAFLFAAFWVWSMPQLGPVLTPLATAGLLLLVAGWLMVVARLLTLPPRPVHPLARPEMLLAEAGRLFREHKAPLLVAALVAGLVSGVKRK